MRRFFLRWSLVVLFACVLAFAAPPAASAAQASKVAQTSSTETSSPAREMDLASYRAELERLSAAAARLSDHPEEIAPLRRSIPKTWSVRSGDQRFEVPTAPLSSTLENMETNRLLRASLQKDAVHRLEALRQRAAALAASSAGPAPKDARAHLEKILRRREFRAVGPPDWLDEMRERITAWLLKMLTRFFRALGGVARTQREILVWSMIALAFIVLALWLRRRLLRAARADDLDLKDSLPPGKSWREWAREALAAAARGDYRAAVHAAYWAGVYRLEELGVWQLDRARTPREYLRLLARSAAKPDVALSTPAAPAPAESAPGHAERAAALAALTRCLELTWYGYQPATPGDFHAAIAQLEALGCRFPSNLQTASS